MDSPFNPLVHVIHSNTIDAWKERNENALATLFGTRYAKRAEKSVALRAADMKGRDTGVPYAAYIHPSNPDAGAYSGLCFDVFKQIQFLTLRGNPADLSDYPLGFRI